MKHPAMTDRENREVEQRFAVRQTLRLCAWSVPATVLLFALLHGFGTPQFGPVATLMALLVSLVVGIALPYQHAVLEAELMRERLELAQRRQLLARGERRAI